MESSRDQALEDLAAIVAQANGEIEADELSRDLVQLSAADCDPAAIAASWLIDARRD